MKPKRFLIFLPCFTNGGAEKQGIILAHALKEMGHNVFVWGFPAIKEISEPMLNNLLERGIDYYQFPQWPRLGWNFSNRPISIKKLLSFIKHWIWPLQRLRKALPTRGFDFVIPFTFYPCLVTSLLHSQMQAKKIIWNHRGGNDSAGFNYSYFLKKKILKAKPIFIANSQDGAKFLRLTFGLSANQVNVIRNAYVPEIIENTSFKSFKNVERRTELLQIANFFPQKDINTVLEGMAILKIRGLELHLHLVGFFLSNADEEKFHKKVNDLGIKEMVTYHGALSRSKVFYLLSKVQVGILSSRSEGMPNSVMEYMFWYLPVVASDIPGIREVLGDEQTNLLFKVGDVHGFVDRIQFVASNPVLSEDIGVRNHHRIVNEFSIENILPVWLDVINKHVCD